MGFFIRKAFRLGPVRLNLSRSGVGVSGGVTGARIGVTSQGRPYLFGGRHGLYVRESLEPSRTGRSERKGGRGERVVLYERTGVTYADDAPEPLPEAGEIRAPVPPARFPFVVLAGLGVLLLLVPGGPVGWVLGGGVAAFGGWRAVRTHRRREAILDLREALGRMVRSGSWDPSAEEGLRAAGAEGGGTWVARELELAFLEACQALASGERIDEEELELLDRLEAALGGPSTFTREARVDAFRGLCSLLVSDHELTDEEEAVLERVREGLRLDASEIEEELAVLDRFREVRDLRDGALPEVEPPVPLLPGELGHFVGEGRRLRERQLRRFQRDRVRYAVRGFVLDREGQLLITNRRLVLVDGGAYEIRLREILDLEVDLDENVIRITRDGRVRPVFFTTPGAFRAGAILAALTGM